MNEWNLQHLYVMDDETCIQGFQFHWFFSSPDPKSQVSYCYHVVSVHLKFFIKSSPLKVTSFFEAKCVLPKLCKLDWFWQRLMS
jgi:hypothetical protein